MSQWTILLPIILGCVGILQGALNGQISNSIGVAQATFLTTVGSAIICTGFYFFVKNYSHLFPDFFQVKTSITTFKWWYVFPALFGFFIVAGMPLAISKLGAVKVTVGLIAAQMITSVVWDLFIEGIGLNILKLVGIIFAFLSVTFITLSKQ